MNKDQMISILSGPKIPGDYQFRANYRGSAIQRFWHHQRKLLIDSLLVPCSSDVILDIGCGSGVFAEYVSRTGAQVYGVDLNQESIGFAQRTFCMDNLQFLCQPIHKIGLPDQSVDKILMLEVVEHLAPEYAEQVWREAVRLLRVGGRLLVTTPNYRSAYPIIEWLMDCLHLVPSLNEQHIIRTTMSYLKKSGLSCHLKLGPKGYYSYVAPFVAPLSWWLAEQIACWELRLPLPGGMEVYACWQKE